MSETQHDTPDDLLARLGSALDDLMSGRLDADLPSIDPGAPEVERELVARFRELIVARRRALQKLGHIASAIESGLREVRERVSVAAGVHSEITASASACDASASALSESARGVRAQTNELHALIESAGDATSNLAESGREATAHSEKLSAAVGDVAAGATAIAASMSDIDRAIGDLAGDVTLTSSAVAAIDSSIRSIDAGVGETSALSAQMSAAAANGIEVVRETADAVAAMNAAIGGVGQSMDHLVARSEEVAEITKIIQGIAVQAKLLALNASIQAAHAGEAGRGFSVVAREIKQLSDSTAASTRDIETLVRSILDEIGLAREEARTSRERAARGLELANAASVALDAVYAEVEHIRARVVSISDATSAQARETASLKRSIGRVSDLADVLRRTATERIASSQKVVGRVREISDLAYRVRAAMADQEGNGLAIVDIIARLMSVAGALEEAVDHQTSSTEELARVISQIDEAGETGTVAVAAMAYANGVLEQKVDALRDQLGQVRLPRPVRGGEVVVPAALPGANFDPITAPTENHALVLECLYETLVASREEGNLVPCLAERWDASADGLVWRFRLRPGVLFHHGRALTADDVVFTLERLARDVEAGAFILSSVRGAAAFRSGDAPSLAGVRATGALEVTIELSEPVAFFLNLLALSFANVVPRDVVEQDPEGFARAPVGTGPFRAVDVRDDRVRLERWEHYRDPEQPYLDAVEFDLDVTPEDALLGVLEGRYAFTKYIPRGRLPELLASSESRSRVLSITQPHCHYLLFNCREGRLADARVRRAIAHAIDRDDVVRVYGPGPLAEPGSGLIPPTCPGYDPSLTGPVYDPEVARALLDEAGYDRARPIELVVASSPWSFGLAGAASIRDALACVGLRLEARVVDDVLEARRTGDFDAVEAQWYGDYLDPDTFTFGAFHSRLGAYHGLWDLPVLDELYERARATADPARRAALYRQIHWAFFDACPAVVLLHRRDHIVHSPRVEGVQLYPLIPTVRARDLWIPPNERD
jgi:ABC-type transport system substrate-binding protein